MSIVVALRKYLYGRLQYFWDDNWNAVKNYIEKEMKQEHSDKDPMYFDYYDPKDMDRVINTQEKVVQYMKKKQI